MLSAPLPVDEAVPFFSKIALAVLAAVLNSR